MLKHGNSTSQIISLQLQFAVLLWNTCTWCFTRRQILMYLEHSQRSVAFFWRGGFHFVCLFVFMEILVLFNYTGVIYFLLSLFLWFQLLFTYNYFELSLFCRSSEFIKREKLAGSIAKEEVQKNTWLKFTLAIL